MRTWKENVLIPAILLAVCAAQAAAEEAGRVSKTVTSVLREPLPPEDLSCRSSAGEIVIEGATYTYAVNKANGAVSSLQVRREGEVVVRLDEPVEILIDDYRLASGENSAGTEVVSRSDEQVVLKTEGVLKDPKGQRPDLPYGLETVFYNDGVAVAELKLLPRQDVLISKGISYHVAADGRFSHYIHKRRDQHGSGSSWGNLPEAGKSVPFTTLTSCLEVFSPEAALAIFTDGGAIHLAKSGLETAVLGVETNAEGRASVSLDQYMVNIDRGGEPYLLKAGTEFTFRVGISIAPNRLPHPRRHDLRHYVWIGDQKHPYPTDEEILDAARLGYTLFQMHRVGAPGKPRPPAGELERVIEKVHEAGMLFIWEVNADLIYASLERVSQMQEDRTWPLWQGFNYGGRYRASMDPYCDLVATCLASPNGLAEFRLECLTKMMEKYDVDGVHVDDNLAYANCSLWKEHGHPRKVYDCLIELHEMNWRRRQPLRKLCPHVVLIDHCTKALILPVICDFDAHLYGEGYGLSSLESYWNFFGSINNMYAQGNLWAGDSEGSRCTAAVAYNFDLLTGGGQYMCTDWRLYPEKFPYASGVTKEEPLFVKTYNLPQCYFGMLVYTPWDPWTILDWGKANRGQGRDDTICMCVHFATLFAALAAALGHRARCVVISDKLDEPTGHFMAEVWDDGLGRWVLHDPNYDVEYVDGEPLSVIDLAERSHEGRALDDWVVAGKGMPKGPPRVTDAFREYFASGRSFRHTGIWSANQYVSDPSAAPPNHGAIGYCETEIVWYSPTGMDLAPMFPCRVAGRDYFDRRP